MCVYVRLIYTHPVSQKLKGTITIIGYTGALHIAKGF